jgi:quercetin dioxygenase-like cupin family protein
VKPDADGHHPKWMHKNEIVRRPLLNVPMDLRVSKVDVREIVFHGGMQTGRHLHPCPVIGYIAEGSVLFQIEGEAVQTLHAGDAFHEPAGVVIARFDNASETAPMKFIAYYLLAGEQELIQMLPEK